MYSLSTCWNSNRHTDGRVMLREIRDLGFEYAELSHGIRLSLVPGILEAVGAGEIRISSVHNFCPLPIGVTHAAPNLYKFTSLETRERENALRYTLKTLELAARVKARVVVLHFGAVEMKEYTERLLELAEHGDRETPKYEKLCREAVAVRERRKERHLEAAALVMRPVAEAAAKLGLQLGIENREAVEEVPFEEDFPFFFRDYPQPHIGYWHDTGHAQIKENLGFIRHEIHLESMAERLIGFHLHDVRFPGGDHLPPGQGSIDFAALKPHVRPEHLKVFELSPRVEAEAIGEAMRFMKSVWGDQ